MSDINKIKSKVNSLDFQQQKAKMANKKYGEGWSPEKIDIIEQQYRNYLIMWALYPGKSLPPSSDVDVFWHNHILDTKKYHHDCEIVFNQYRDHYPYFGLRGEKDEEDLQFAFEKTLKLYEDLFHEELYDIEEVLVK